LKVLLVPFGSHGDVHPLLGLGRALRDRGHDVSCLVFEYFGPLVRRMGINHVDYGDSAEYEQAINHPDLWHPRRSFRVVADGVRKSLRPVYEAIAQRYVEGETVVVAGSLAFGARIAQDKLGVPTATVHLQPGVFRTVHDVPNFGGMTFPRRLPRFGKRLFFRLIEYLTDQHLAPSINAVRAELGLPKVHNLMFTWVNSPTLVLGLFPDWYGPPQPDWPSQTALTGFPLFDETGISPLSPELTEFLDAGEPPIVFTPGSAMKRGHAFFEAAAESCHRLNRRGMLLTRFPEQIPKSLPDGVRHFSYAPFSQILPRCAALVHHGGIGTSAQALAAGVPQLIMPLAHDQFDNAERLEHLGVARSLIPKRFQGPKVSQMLDDLTRSDEIARNCRLIADRMKREHPLDAACDRIERMIDRKAEGVTSYS
jgi:rhamnosyltransferase subunit B